MKKRFLIVLAITMFMTIFSMGAYAEMPENANGTAELYQNKLVDSSTCSHPVTETIDTWVENNYYYTRVWRTERCEICGYTWSTAIDIPNNVWYGSTSDEKAA